MTQEEMTLIDVSRHIMWERILPHTKGWNNKQKKKKPKVEYAVSLGQLPGDIHPNAQDIQQAKDKIKLMGKMKEMYIETTAQGYTHTYSNPLVSFGCNPAAPTPCVEPPKRKKKMRYDDCDYCESSTTPVETKQRQYLLGRLYNIKDMKETEARKTFGLTEDAVPRTADDLIARIKDGKYVLDEEVLKASKKVWHAGVFTGIEWRDPAVKKDQDGFDAFLKKLDTAYINTQDLINIGSPADGLKSLKDFEANTLS